MGARQVLRAPFRTEVFIPSGTKVLAVGDPALKGDALHKYTPSL